MTYCSEILKQKENEIKQLKKENQDTVRCLNSVDDKLQALKKQVEAAKTILKEFPEPTEFEYFVNGYTNTLDCYDLIQIDIIKDKLEKVLGETT